MADADVTGKSSYRPGALFRRTRQDPTLRREADMMGFYLSITLIAALTAGSDKAPHTQGAVLRVVWGSVVALALAHWFAITVSSRLVRDPDVHHTPLEVLCSQIVMGVILALAASAAVLLAPPDLERFGARLTAALFIGVLVEIESRAGGSTLRRAVGHGALALAVAFAIATAKLMLSH